VYGWSWFSFFNMLGFWLLNLLRFLSRFKTRNDFIDFGVAGEYVIEMGNSMFGK